MRKPLNNLLLAAASVFGLALATGSVYAAYAVDDRASSFSVTIRAGEAPKKTITYHLPDSSDNTYTTFLTDTEDVIEGSTLGSASISTPSFLGFTFQGWYSDSSFTSPVSDSTAINANTEIYAKYTRPDVLYYYTNTHHYYYQSVPSGDTTLTQRYYYTGTQVFGVAGITNGSTVDMTSASGVYQFSYSSSTYNATRKVGVSKANVSSWWTGDGAVTKLYAFNDSLSLHLWYDISFSGNVGYTYVDPRCGGFIVCRINPSGVADPWNNMWNQTVDVFLNTLDSYDKDSIVIQVQDNKTDNKNNAYWRAS